MEDSKLNAYRSLAQAWQYPYPGLLAELQEGAQKFPRDSARKAFASFLAALRRLSLGEWEELYTHTLDLNPAIAPYIGYQLWGDGYPRGNFMAALNRAYRDAAMEMEGELPDHMGCVLGFLETGSPPPPELVEAFEPAVQKMLTTLRKAEPANPYVYLLEAVAYTVDLKTVEIQQDIVQES